MACKKVRNMENIIKVSMFESAQNRYASGVVNLWDWLFLEDYRTVLIKELRNESDLMKQQVERTSSCNNCQLCLF